MYCQEQMALTKRRMTRMLEQRRVVPDVISGYLERHTTDEVLESTFAIVNGILRERIKIDE